MIPRYPDPFDSSGYGSFGYSDLEEYLKKLYGNDPLKQGIAESLGRGTLSMNPAPGDIESDEELKLSGMMSMLNSQLPELSDPDSRYYNPTKARDLVTAASLVADRIEAIKASRQGEARAKLFEPYAIEKAKAENLVSTQGIPKGEEELETSQLANEREKYLFELQKKGEPTPSELSAYKTQLIRAIGSMRSTDINQTAFDDWRKDMIIKANRAKTAGELYAIGEEVANPGGPTMGAVPSEALAATQSQARQGVVPNAIKHIGNVGGKKFGSLPDGRWIWEDSRIPLTEEEKNWITEQAAKQRRPQGM